MNATTILAPPDAGPADSVCAAAVDTARDAARTTADDAAHVGEHLGVVGAGERTAVHRFGCLHPGYVGWVWAVAVARAPRLRTATVDEVWLEPGEGALVAPAWQPWAQRVRPGDLGPGDVFATAPDDPRLAPGWSGDDDLAGPAAETPLSPEGWEPGLGRVRVLSALGREEAADRWADGDTGPSASMARSAPAPCSTCGWLLTIGGPLGQGFGLCANEMSPADGRAVTLDHGCGAHSQVAAEPAPTIVVGTVIDELGWESVARPAALPPAADDAEAPSAAAADADAPAGTDDDVAAVEESLDQVALDAPGGSSEDAPADAGPLDAADSADADAADSADADDAADSADADAADDADR